MAPDPFIERLRQNTPVADPQAVPAATVILLRDGERGVETLMLRKSSNQAFGGMWVFPGGRVDEGDLDPGNPDDELAAARQAAAREALEETGLVVDPAAFVPLSHWTPPAAAPRRYTTWFFVAEAPLGDVAVDMGEIVESEWVAPADVLARRDAGEVELAPPTWVTLKELSSQSTVAGTLAAAGARDPDIHVTSIGKLDGGALVAMWAGDAGYDDGDATRHGPRHRLIMDSDTWRYERDV
jgi:8-oxo-dGTP pyrophosphatase MutT (NUDIX family)